jgi:bifunctional non-homologous end joining protein LigD
MSKIAERPHASRRSKATSPEIGDGRSVLRVEGKEIPVSHLDKILYPKAGFTKAQIIDYYIRIAPVLLPHLNGRPLTLKRYPNGVEAPFFYEKRCPVYRPKWVDTATVWSKHNQAEISFCLANDLPTLVWAANLSDLELHTYLAKKNAIDCPTMIVFDLDPGPPANILQCAEVALWIKAALEKIDLEIFAKTSGSKGLQLYIPLNTPTNYEATKSFARTLAENLEDQNPKLVLSKMSKSLRKGKVLVDWSQNDAHKTTICVYSLRAKERPTVSTPVTWREIEVALKKKDPMKLSFISDEVLKRVEEMGDIFAPVLKLKQKIPQI